MFPRAQRLQWVVRGRLLPAREDLVQLQLRRDVNAAIESLRERLEHLLRRSRLQQESADPASQRLHNRLPVPPRREHDDLRWALCLPDAPHYFEREQVRQIEIK